MRLSPNIDSSDLSDPPTFDQKVNVFQDRVLGWQLNIADLVINDHGNHSKIEHSGFATLSIVLSYFEAVAKFENGRVQDGQSGDYFKMGVRSVFPVLATLDGGHVDAMLDHFYEGARCGMYHAGMTASGIILSGDPLHAIVFYPERRTLIINPHRLVPLLKDHFGSYISRLRNPTEIQLRQNFLRRYDSLQ